MMKMKYLIILAVCFIAGCTTNPKPVVEVLIQKEYITRTAPDVLKQLPLLPAELPDNASNNAVATWISNTEEYVANLEAMIKELINFYESK